MMEQNKFIDQKYMPTGITLKDPSKLKQSEVMKIFQHWNDRILANKIGFKFKHCLPGHSRVVLNKGRGIRKGVKMGKQKKVQDVNQFEE